MFWQSFDEWHLDEEQNDVFTYEQTLLPLGGKDLKDEFN